MGEEGERKKGQGIEVGGGQKPHILGITEAPALFGPKAPSSGCAAKAEIPPGRCPQRA